MAGATILRFLKPDFWLICCFPNDSRTGRCQWKCGLCRVSLAFASLWLCCVLVICGGLDNPDSQASVPVKNKRLLRDGYGFAIDSSASINLGVLFPGESTFVRVPYGSVTSDRLSIDSTCECLSVTQQAYSDQAYLCFSIENDSPPVSKQRLAIVVEVKTGDRLLHTYRVDVVLLPGAPHRDGLAQTRSKIRRMVISYE